jgi:acetyltransferase-like isoleucine patch superfamily enzyme
MKNNDELNDLHDQLISLYKKLRKKKQDKWDRTLPFNELLFDRWEKASFLKSKKEASVYDSSFVFGNVKIGEKSWIGPFTILDGSGGKLRIGKFCSVSSGVQIYTHDSVKWSLTGGKIKIEKNDVSVGDYCYIGPNSVISKGVRIGKRCVIGAQSFVTTDIPAHSIVFGVPGKIVGKVILTGKKVEFKYYEKS